MENVLDLDQVCDIANEVYFDVIDHLEIKDKCVESNSTGGTRNTDFGRDLYYLIEDSIKASIKYREEDEDDDE